MVAVLMVSSQVVSLSDVLVAYEKIVNERTRFRVLGTTKFRYEYSHRILACPDSAFPELPPVDSVPSAESPMRRSSRDAYEFVLRVQGCSCLPKCQDGVECKTSTHNFEQVELVLWFRSDFNAKLRVPIKIKFIPHFALCIPKHVSFGLYRIFVRKTRAQKQVVRNSSTENKTRPEN